MAGGFRVDLGALERAAEGVSGTVYEARRQKVNDIDCDKSAVGHDRLADTVSDFCDRWQRGVDNLAKDGQEIAGRLTDSVNAYREVDKAMKGQLDGMLRRASGPDPASALMAELGETDDPRALVPGMPDAVHGVAWALRAHGDVLHAAGAGLRRIDTTDGWSGKAGDQFRDAFHGQPGKWLEAGDCFHRASQALERYTSTLRWAQRQAADAIRLWYSAQAATRKAKAEHATALERAKRESAAQSANGTPTVAPNIPFSDPGEAGREAARQTLRRAREQLKSSGNTAADVVGRARDQAPQQPGFWSKVGSGLAGAADDAWHAVEDFGAHAVNDLASFGNAATNHPGDMLTAAGGIALTTVSAVGDGLGAVLDATGVGAIGGVPLNVASTAGVVGGVGITGAAVANIAHHAAGDDHIEPLKTDHASSGAGSEVDTPPGVKPGWEAGPARNGKGTVWKLPGTKGNADSMRIAEPTPRYPNGYVRFYNEHGQPVDLDGKPTSDPETHIPRASDGTYPLPKGW